MINSIGIALTGLNSAAMRLNASASNVANMSNPQYNPITIKTESIDTGGVMTGYTPKSIPFTNVDIAEDIVNMKMASLSYKANLNTIKVAGNMFDELLNVFKD